MKSAIIALFSAFLGSVLGPLVQKWLVDPIALRQQKERNCYEVFLRDIEEIYKDQPEEEKVKEICKQYRMAWLYADDPIIESLNAFFRSEKFRLKSLKEASPDRQFGAVILEMRKRNLKRTHLTPNDYLLASQDQLLNKVGSQP